VSLRVNGEPVEPGRFHRPVSTLIGGPRSICFDSLFSWLLDLNQEELGWSGLKPLMNLRPGLNNITYIVEVYAASQHLDKNFSVDILVGPPYVAVMHPDTK